jgi:glycerol uptake facilitator-like aquaporin
MPRKGIFASWEDIRNTDDVHWAMECFAEMLGVFMFVYLGVGSEAGWVIGNIMKIEGFSNILQIGFAYSFGIYFAIIVCASTSGGHFNPAVTIAFCVFKKFPVLKTLRYIAAQILGAYIACLFVYTQWKVFIDESEVLQMAAGQAEFAANQFTPNGLPGIFVPYLLPEQTLPRAFLNEFVTCFIIGLIIWSALDPTNYFVPPVMLPFVIAFAFCVTIWGFAVPGVALNSARDMGARLMAITIWGVPAGGGTYAAIAGLANIPATLLAVCVYEFILVDSDRVISGFHMDFINYNMKHGRMKQDDDDITSINLARIDNSKRASVIGRSHNIRDSLRM